MSHDSIVSTGLNTLVPLLYRHHGTLYYLDHIIIFKPYQILNRIRRIHPIQITFNLVKWPESSNNPNPLFDAVFTPFRRFNEAPLGGPPAGVGEIKLGHVLKSGLRQGKPSCFDVIHSGE